MNQKTDATGQAEAASAVVGPASKWSDAAERVLRERYLLRDATGAVVETPDDMCWRVARAVAAGEQQWARDQQEIEEIARQFYTIMAEHTFLPNSPTLMNAGKGNHLQLSACYVVPVEDSLSGIFDAVKHAALIHQSGGGTGFSFSRLRPAGSIVGSTHGVASGPVSFMKIFDGATEAVKQGGCVVPQTRVATARGLVRIGTLGPTAAEPKSWHPLAQPLTVYTDEGSRKAEEFYHNGRSAIRRVRTRHGYHFAGTPEHRVRVLDASGAYVWRRLKDVRAGDWVALQKNTYPDSTDFRFAPSVHAPASNAAIVTTPTRPSPELGELIGYSLGDESINDGTPDAASGSLVLRVAAAAPEVGAQLVRAAANLFELVPTEHSTADDASVTYAFTAPSLVAWLEHIGAGKRPAAEARVPEVIFHAGAEFARGFLRGVFTVHGGVSQAGYPQLYSAARGLIEDVQQLLLALGVPSAISVNTARRHRVGSTNPTYRLRVITQQGVREFADRIGFMAAALNQRLDAGAATASDGDDIIPNQQTVIAALLEASGLGSGPEHAAGAASRMLYKDVVHYLPDAAAPRHLTRLRLRRLVDEHAEVRASTLAWFLTNEQFYDQVAGIADDEAVTVDLAVEQNHTYIANGFVSHNTRRGANMGILRVDHPDILQFIDCKRDGSVANFNISVGISDEYMRALERDEEYDLIDPHTHQVARRLRARDVMDRIIAAAWATGDPGLVFIDRANASTANPTPEIEPLEATNPCVVGETRLATDRGLVRVDALHASGDAVRVATDWRVPGQALTAVVHGASAPQAGAISFHEAAPVARTGERVPVWKLTTSHGIEITATPNHRFLTTAGYKRLDELQYGDTLLLQSDEGAWPTARALPPIHYEPYAAACPPREWSPAVGEVVGYVLGDGYARHGASNDVVGLAANLADYDAVVVPVQERMRTWFGMPGMLTRRHGRYQVRYAAAAGTFLTGLGIGAGRATSRRVPESVFAAPRDAVIGFLRGFASATGRVRIGCAANGTCSIRLGTPSKGLARDVQQLLLNLGIVSTIRLRRPAQLRRAPGDAARAPRQHSGPTAYDIIIDHANRDQFAQTIGFMQPEQQARLRAWSAGRACGSEREPYTTQVALIEAAGCADVYDTTEPATHSIIVNGLATHNCGEQWLGPYDACNLGSINLGLFVHDGAIAWDALERVTRITTRFLDNVIEINPYPLPEVREKVRANRRIGLGIMGWAEMLFALELRYDSQEATTLGERVMRAVREWSTDESRRLAEVRGAFPNWERSIYRDGPPLRNATRTTVAPTGSISILADCSSGIEPIFALAFQHRVKQPDGSYRVLDFVNPFFRRALETSDIADRAAVLAYVQEHGSLHGHPAAEHPMLRPFVTAHDIAPEWHIRMQAAFQKGVDNSISKCLAAGTLIPTAQGLIAIEDFSDVETPDTFVRIADVGLTTGGHRILSHYYAGEAPATRIRLDNGVELVGSTASHRVFTPTGWKRLAELRPTDIVVGRFSATHGPGAAPLPRPDALGPNAARVTIPERMSADMALFLGMMSADGHAQLTSAAVSLTSSDPTVLDAFSALAARLFGLTPSAGVDDREAHVGRATLNSRVLRRWVCSLLGEEASTRHVPAQVLAGSAEEKLAYLRGVSLAGYRHPELGLYIYAGIAQCLAYGIAEVCRSFGLPLVRTQRSSGGGTGNTSHQVLISNELQELVECLEPQKNGAAHFATYPVLVDQEIVERTKLPANHPFYAALPSIAQGRPRALDNRTAQRVGWAEDIPVYGVTAVEDAGVCSLYDIEVEDAHEYVVNGIVSHNTINLPHSATYEDVRQAYMLAWELGCLGITVFRDGSKGEQVLNVGVKDSASESQARAPSVPAAAPTPQGAPATAPLRAQEISERKGQYRHGVKVRPDVVQGYTRQVRAPEGKVLITLNSDDDGLLEVFVNVGKAGSDVSALAEALGRLLSIYLRVDSPVAQNERATEAAEQLRSIGGSASIGFGQDRVRSLPDAVARAIELHLAGQGTAGAPPAQSSIEAATQVGDGVVGGATANGVTPIAAGDGWAPHARMLAQYAVTGNLCTQCGNNTMYYEEGCRKCVSCGYSEC